jgi:hypothetical protein
LAVGDPPIRTNRLAGAIAGAADAVRGLFHPIRRARSLGSAVRAGLDAGQNADREIAALLGLVAADDAEVSRAALEELALCWSTLPPEPRRALATVPAPRWAEAIERVLDADPPAPPERWAALADLVQDIGGATLGSPLFRLLESPDAGVTRAAARALASRAAAVPTSTVLAALLAYDRHRERGVLLAASALMDSPASIHAAGPVLASWFAEPDHPAQLAMRSLLRRTTGAEARRRAWVLLTREGLRAACAERLGASATPEEHAAVLDLAHLLLHPARARALRRAGLTGADALAPEPEELAELDVGARASIPRWVTGLRLARAGEMLDLLAGDPSPTVRLAAVREIVSAGEPAGVVPVADACFDADERVAFSAALATIADASGAGGVSVGALARSPHARVRALAMASGVATPWDGSTSDHRRAAIVAHEADPREVEARIVAGLASSSTSARVGAIRVARWLALIPRVELELLGTLRIHGGDERTAAACAAALGDSTGESAREALHECLTHPAGRVRANAIEALVRAARRRGVGFDASGLADDPHHRVRAAAARVELSSGVDDASVRRLLTPLLEDARAPARATGLWLLERTIPRCAGLAWDGLPSLVAGMVTGDPSPDVRVRARACADALLRGVRAGWSGRTADVPA